MKNGNGAVLEIDRVSLNDDAEYTAQAQKLAEICGERQACEQEERDIESKLMNYHSTKQDRLTEEALRIIGDVEGLPQFEEQKLLSRLKDLRVRIPILTRAETIQRQVVQRVTGIASGRISVAFAPQHRQLVRETAQAAVALAIAAQREQDLRNKLEAKGIQLGMAIQAAGGFNDIGQLNDIHGRIRGYLRELEDRGFLSPQEVKKLIDGGTIKP